MKKFVSLLLALIISFSCLTVAIAADMIYTCPYSRYEYVQGADGSSSFELVACGKTFINKAAYEAHVVTCPYNTHRALSISLSDITGTFVDLYTASNKFWGFVVPLLVKVGDFVGKLASGELF